MKQIKEWQEIGRLEIIRIKKETKRETLEWVKKELDILKELNKGMSCSDAVNEVLNGLREKIDEEIKNGNV